MDNLGCGRASNNNPITIIGRVASPSGQVVDVFFEGAVVLKATDMVEIQRLIQRPSDLAKDFHGHAERPLAFVGIGFGPAPVSDFDRLLWKGEFDETKHPRMPGGCPEGGEFCTVDETSESNDNDVVDNSINQNQILKDLIKNLSKREAKHLLKNRLIAALRVVAGIVADLVPGAGEAFDVYELGQTVADVKNLREEVAAAEAYVRGGPKTLEELRASLEDRSFSTGDAFKKVSLEKYYGSAGPGQDWHHIVWQGGVNGDNIPAGLLHSTENMVRIPRLLHEEITDAYRDTYDDSGKTLRQWLDTQPYEVQRAEGIRVMRGLGIIK
jgi:hypothetical protein